MKPLTVNWSVPWKRSNNLNDPTIRIIGVCDRPCWSSRRRRHDDRKRCLRRRSDFYPRCTGWASPCDKNTSFKNQNFLVKLWSNLQCRNLLRVLMTNSITLIWFVWKSKIKVSEGHKLWGRVFIRNQESNLEPVCRETNFLCAVGASATRTQLGQFVPNQITVQLNS